MSVEELGSKIISSPWFYAAAAVILLWIIIGVSRSRRRKKAQEEYNALSVRYVSVKTVPLMFKMNKATALSKINPDVEKVVSDSKPKFDKVQEELRAISESLNVSDDLLASRKIKDARVNNAETASQLDEAEKDVRELSSALDGVLKQESEQRSQINELKDTFRTLRTNFNEKAGQYVFSYDAIEGKMLQVENDFSVFEEDMYATDFRKAGQTKQRIQEKISEIRRIYEKLPSLLNTAKTLVPEASRELDESVARARQRGVYLDHLDLDRNKELINDSMRSDLNALKNAEIDGVEEHLADCLTRLKQLKGQVDQEIAADGQIEKLSESVFADVSRQRRLFDEMKKSYQNASERYGFDSLEQQMKVFEGQVEGYEKRAEELKRQIAGHSGPSTGIVLGCRELQQQIQLHGKDLEATKERVDKACEDESAAKLEILKMHLIMNEMQSRVRKNHLLMISESYEEDLKKARKMLEQLEELMRQTPLNITLMNEKLSETKDFIFSLYNDVNKILGSANTVEEAIVIANLQRSDHPDVDIELNRAEMCYRSGEYTKALQLAYSAIEMVYPGQAARLIKDKKAVA